MNAHQRRKIRRHVRRVYTPGEVVRDRITGSYFTVQGYSACYHDEVLVKSTSSGDTTYIKASHLEIE